MPVKATIMLNKGAVRPNSYVMIVKKYIKSVSLQNKLSVLRTSIFCSTVCCVYSNMYIDNVFW